MNLTLGHTIVLDDDKIFCSWNGCFLQSLEAVDSSGKGDTLEQLNALRNHLIALGKTDGQLQALRDKTADLPPGKQDITVMEILQVNSSQQQRMFRTSGIVFKLVRTSYSICIPI